MGWAAVDSPRRGALGGLHGRDDDIDAVVRALEVSRLVTLTGAPGIGKTRLALAVAAEHRDRGVVVELGSLGDASLIPAALASALSVQQAPGHSVIETILATLRTKRRLIVLDNCEHLIDACARTVAQLLDGCPDVRVLATSRQPLQTDAELAWPVAPLDVPDVDDAAPVEAMTSYSAVALFVERAARVRPGFTMNAFVADDVADICRRLDGIPLAIELAAARAGMLTPREIATRLGAHLGLLSDQSLGPLARHRTLASALQWSYALLTAAEQAALRRLSVFVGTFELEAAAAVCARDATAPDLVSDLLDRLVSKSLLVADADANQTGRYRLLETVRAYAAERLEQAGLVDETRTAHARYYTARAERAEPELTGPCQLDWFDRIASERANLRAAVQWSIARGNHEDALRLTGALIIFWRVRGPYSEGRELLQAALTAGHDTAPELTAKALWGAGFLALMAGDAPAAAALVEDSLERYRRFGDRGGCARALLILANACQYGDTERSPVLITESVSLAREAGDHWCLAHALGIVGFIEYARHEDLGTARAAFEECLAVARKARDMQGLRFGLIGLGRCAFDQGDYREAESLLSEAVNVTRALGEDYDRVAALTSLGELAHGRGDYARARELVQEALTLTPEIAPPGARIHPLSVLAKVAFTEGDHAQARTLLDEVLSYERSAGVVIVRGRLALSDGDRSGARRLFEEALVIESTQTNKASALNELALLSRGEGDLSSAAALHEEALALQCAAGDLPGIAGTLEAVAGLSACIGHTEHAARLVGSALALRLKGGYARPPWHSARYETDVALLRDSLPAETFARAVTQGEARPLETALAEAFDFPQPTRPRGGGAGRSLTPRELQIAQLVAEGMSNHEIAERLVIAHETVKTHVSHICAKLGVRGRTMLPSAVAADLHESPAAPPSAPGLASDLRSEADSYKLLEALRWPGGEPVCPHCGSVRKHYFLAPKGGTARRTRTGSLSQRRVWKCADCRRPFSVLTGTILHRSKVPLRTWVLVVSEMTGTKTGVSAHEIERGYALTPETASFMISRLREALRREPLARLLAGRVVSNQTTMGRRETSNGHGHGPAPSCDRRADSPGALDADVVATYLAEIQRTAARARRQREQA